MTVASEKMDGCRHQEGEGVRQWNLFKRCGGMVEGQWVKARRDDWSQVLHEWKVKILFDVFLFMDRMFVLYAFTRSFILRITLDP